MKGTVGLELLDQIPDLDAIIVPVSGGGLISGISIAAKAFKPNIIILAAEPTGMQSSCFRWLYWNDCTCKLYMQ